MRHFNIAAGLLAIQRANEDDLNHRGSLGEPLWHPHKPDWRMNSVRLPPVKRSRRTSSGLSTTVTCTRGRESSRAILQTALVSVEEQSGKHSCASNGMVWL